MRLSVFQFSIDHPAEVFGVEVAHLVLLGLAGNVLRHFLHVDVDVFVVRVLVEEFDIVLADDVDEVVEFFLREAVLQFLRQVVLDVFDRQAVVLSILDEVFLKGTHSLADKDY